MEAAVYKDVTEAILSELMDGKEFSSQTLPILKSSLSTRFPKTLTISFLCKFRSDVILFFQEMICKWLIPGERVFFETFFSARIKGDYLLIQGGFSVLSEKIEEIASRNLPLLLEEIRLGLMSRYHARCMLEMKGLSSHEKKGRILERISAFVERFPELFDADIYPLMQHYLLEQSEGFIQARSESLLTRIIRTLYFFIQRLTLSVEESDSQRHIEVKLIHAKGETPFGVHHRLGVFIGMTFLNEREVFEKRRLLKVLERYFPNIQIVEDSYFVQQDRERRFFVLYVEMEKDGGESFFDQKEIALVKKGLVSDLNGCIEGLLRPIFMPRNEEEVLKYSVTLSSQIKMIRDIPQVVVMFDEQTDSDLFFTVVIARVLFPKSKPIEELLSFESKEKSGSVEKVRKIGFVRKKFPKEISVIKIRLANSFYLREDASVDLYSARLEVSSILTEALGEVRDYNGGMIAKQREIFLSVQDLFGDGEDSSILESFFHSLYPIELRVAAPISSVKEFYQLFQKVRLGEEVEGKRATAGALYFCRKFSDRNEVKIFFEEVQKREVFPARAMRLDFSLMQSIYVGFILFTDSMEEQRIFLQTIEEIISRNQI